MPWYRVSVAHFERALLALNMRVYWSVVAIELAIGAALSKAPSEVWKLTQSVQFQVPVVSEIRVRSRRTYR